MEVAAYILAGGKSSRMGSDKGLLPLNKFVFIEHIVNALKGVSIKNITIISSNADYDFLNCDRIQDIYPDKGPVGGIFTALKHSETEKNLIVSVDIPLISSEIIQWLIANIDGEKQITQVKVKDKTNPLIAVYNRNLISDFKENLIKEELRLTHIVSKIPNKTIDVPEKWCELLQSINTKEDYQNLLQ